MKRKSKRILVALLALSMLLSYVPAFAEDVPAEEPGIEIQSEPGIQPESEPETQSKPEAEQETLPEAQPEAQPDSAQENGQEEEFEQKEEPEQEEKSELDFTPDKQDFLTYDPLYIAKYANSDYVNVEEVELGRYIHPVTSARGVASYVAKKISDADKDPENTFATMHYELPIYDVDDDSDYYVAIPNVNKFNDNFKAFGLVVAYDNDFGETISGCKYEKGILYIPKKVIDRPKNENELDAPGKSVIAVQLSYAIGDDMDFSKTIPAQILTKEEPKNIKVQTENIFDIEALTVNTKVRNRAEEDISVFLNGQMMPAGGWSYDKSTGDIYVQAMPGVISSINVVFESQTKTDAIKTSALNFLTAAPLAQAATLKSMKYLKNKDGKKVKITSDTSALFVGWRGHYKTGHKFQLEESEMRKLDGWQQSKETMYGGKTEFWGGGRNSSGKISYNKADGTSTTDVHEIDAGLTPLWAISTYATGGDTSIAFNSQKDFTYKSKVKHYVTKSKTEEKTLYEWLMEYRNKLEKAKNTDETNQGNSIGGANNYAFHWPEKISGSSVGFVPNADKSAALPNPDFTLTSDQISKSDWFCAGCSELKEGANTDGDGDRDVYVTCLAKTSSYIVFAFAYTSANSQNACAIYKFGLESSGEASMVKISGAPEITD